MLKVWQNVFVELENSFLRRPKRPTPTYFSYFPSPPLNTRSPLIAFKFESTYLNYHTVCLQHKHISTRLMGVALTSNFWSKIINLI